MLEVHLKLPAEGRPSTHLTAIVEELAQLQAQRAKVYRTRCETGGLSYTLTTTSKDIQLGIGRLSESALEHLCALLDETFRQQAVTELLLFSDSGSREGILVSLTQSDNFCVRLTLSPAR